MAKSNKTDKDEAFNAFIDGFKRASRTIEPPTDLQEKTLAAIASKPSVSPSETQVRVLSPKSRRRSSKKAGFVFAGAAAACLIVASLFVVRPWSSTFDDFHSANTRSAYAVNIPVSVSGMNIGSGQASNLILPANEGEVALQFFASFRLSAPDKKACTMRVDSDSVEINREANSDDALSKSEIEAFNESWGQSVPVDPAAENTVAVRIFTDVDDNAWQYYFSGDMSADEKSRFAAAAKSAALAKLKEVTVSFNDDTGAPSRYRFEGTFEDLELSAIE